MVNSKKIGSHLRTYLRVLKCTYKSTYVYLRIPTCTQEYLRLLRKISKSPDLGIMPVPLDFRHFQLFKIIFLLSQAFQKYQFCGNRTENTSKIFFCPPSITFSTTVHMERVRQFLFLLFFRFLKTIHISSYSSCQSISTSICRYPS